MPMNHQKTPYAPWADDDDDDNLISSEGENLSWIVHYYATHS